MEAYFDNSATTRVFDCVKDIVVRTMTEDYGNAAAKHSMGVKAEQYIREARAVIARSLKVREKEIVFTSGGSESNNMALIGAAMANRRNRRTHRFPVLPVRGAAPRCGPPQSLCSRSEERCLCPGGC